MRVYLMTDMEGVAGVLDHDNWCQPPGSRYPGRYYDLGREFLTLEVNAAVDGLFAGGAEAVTVSDGHGAGGINPNLLDERARLLRGWPTGWPVGLDAGYDAVAWVGQHAKAGTTLAHIAHTQWFNYIDLSVNDVSIGEYGQLALCAGELGLPALFASGDRAFCEEAQRLTPGVVTVAVKEGLEPDDGRTLDTNAYMAHNLAAIHLQPQAARKVIRQGALDAARRFCSDGDACQPLHLQAPYERVTLLRRDESHDSVRVHRCRHPDSIAALLNQPLE
ncbi:MAG: M55 family metallopeptidase [Anaerolineae bacterium]